MTGLVFFIDDDNIVIGMDTLMMSLENSGTKKPLMMCSKVLPLMQTKSILCGVGDMTLFTKWYIEMNINVLGKDIIFLKNAVNNLIETFVKTYGGKWQSSTIYHFGYSVADDKMLGFAVDFNESYAIRDIEYGLCMRPSDIQKIEDGLEKASEKATISGKRDMKEFFYEILITMMEIENKKTSTDRINIGGEMQFVHMNKELIIQMISIPLPGYELLFQKCLNHPRMKKLYN